MRIKGEPGSSSESLLVKRKIMNQDMEQKIWEYIDGHCTPVEKAAIIQQLADNPVWKSKYEELKRVHDLLGAEELEMPSLRFTKNVMEEISRYQVAPATKTYINKNVIRGIGSFFLVMITGLFIYILAQIHWTSTSSSNLIPNFSVDANKLNWGKMLNNTYVNIFVGINIILGLILLDKYMQGRKKTEQPGH